MRKFGMLFAALVAAGLAFPANAQDPNLSKLPLMPYDEKANWMDKPADAPVACRTELQAFAAARFKYHKARLVNIDATTFLRSIAGGNMTDDLNAISGCVNVTLAAVRAADKLASTSRTISVQVLSHGPGFKHELGFTIWRVQWKDKGLYGQNLTSFVPDLTPTQGL